MLNQYVKTALLAGLLFTSVQANAALIVDTGTPNNTGGFDVNGAQSIAGQFHVNQASTIDAVYSYLSFQDNGFGPGSFNLSLYDQGQAAPVGDAVYTVSVSYSSSDAAWVGADHLNWAVASGDYWVGIEVIDGQSNFVAPTDASHPLVHTAYTDGSFFGAYKGFDGMAFGLQVDAVTAVPEPSTIGMLLAGLGLIAFMSFKRRQL